MGSKGEVIPTPGSALVSGFGPSSDPDADPGTFPLVSLVPAPSLVPELSLLPAPSLDLVPLFAPLSYSNFIGPISIETFVQAFPPVNIDVFDAAFTPVFVLVVCLGVLASCLCRSVTVIVTT